MAEGIAFIHRDFCPIDEAGVPITDPGFSRGDAVYDTTSVWKGSFFRLDDHIERFFASFARARLAPPVDAGGLKRLLAQCVQRAGLESAYVQMISTRGRFKSLTNRDPRTCDNTIICFAVPYIWIVQPERQLEGIDLVVVSGNRRIPPESIDPRMKNFNWLDLQRGLLEALDRGGDTGVLCTPDGRLSEGPGFNVFTAHGSHLRTPRGNVLEGMTRRTVSELADELGLSCAEDDLTADDLRSADEAFLSSTAGGIMPVASVDGVPLAHGRGAGPTSLALRERYWSKRESGWLGTPVDTLA